jgi:hypothetical protein
MVYNIGQQQKTGDDDEENYYNNNGNPFLFYALCGMRDYG